jgi:hypothetical protein
MTEEQKIKRKRVEEESSEESEEQLEENNDEDNSDQGNSNGFHDGFADTVLNLLKQDTGKKNPVLSGRKTTLMKQLQENTLQMKEADKRKVEKRRKLEGKMANLQDVNIEFERQLRKLATKGVVALFNCVAKAKKEMIAEQSESKKKQIELKEKEKQKESVSSSSALSASFQATRPKSMQQGENQRSSIKTTAVSKPKKWSVVDETATEGLLMVSFCFFLLFLFLSPYSDYYFVFSHRIGTKKKIKLLLALDFLFFSLFLYVFLCSFSFFCKKKTIKLNQITSFQISLLIEERKGSKDLFS